MNNDIKFLEKITNQKPMKNFKLFDYKQVLKMKMKEKYNKYLPLSNINESFCISVEYTYGFDYQRYDATLQYNNYFKNLYDIDDLKTKTIFTNSGMAAINAIIKTLQKYSKYKIKYSKDIYFETQKLIKLLNTNKLCRKILWLDTISYNFEFTLNNIAKYEIIIIDTTCFHSHLFKDLIYAIINSGKLCILLRSHTKLDMLGLEYCTLGSITYVLPRKIDTFKWKKLKKMIIFNMEYIGHSGLGVTEHNIFPLLNNKKIITLNKKRIMRIIKNNLYVYNKLHVNNKFILPNHSLFLLLNVNLNMSLNDLKNKVIDFCENNKICFFSPSFAFDYIALDTYYDSNMKAYTIRISIGDVKLDVIDKFIVLLSEFINDYL